MLLEIVDGKPRVFAGIGMSMRLVVKLGPRRSLRLSKLVAQTHRDQQVADPSRREFLRQASLSFGGLTLLFGWPASRMFTKEIYRREADDQELTFSVFSPEMYEGFVILSEVEAPIPAFVKRPQPHRQDETYTVSYDSIDELRKFVPFPLYILSESPYAGQFLEGSIVFSIKTQQVLYVYCVYGLPNNTEERREIKARVIALREYFQPFPIWPSQIAGADIVTVPVRVEYTPSPGILLSSLVGHQLHWIQDGIAYSLLIEEGLDHTKVERMTRSLKSI